MNIIIKNLNLNTNELMKNYNLTLKKYIPYETNEQIEKDITRTFSNFSYFNKKADLNGYDRLHRLLIALSTYDDLGYIQGINFIAASFLWHCDEEYAFAIVCKLFDILNMKNIFYNNLSNVNIKCDQFYENVLKYEKPHI